MTQAAIDRAVKPAVATCVANLLAMDLETTTQIANIRQSVNDIVASLAKSSGGGGKELQKLANKLLHEPTMELREGNLSHEDVQCVVGMIETQLIARCGCIEAI